MYLKDSIQLLTGEEVLKGVRQFHPLFFSRLAQPNDETFLFVVVFGWVCCWFCLVVLLWFCFWFLIVSFPFLHTKAVESFKSQWNLLQRCLGKSRAVRPSVSKAKETTGMYNGPLNKLPR